MEDYSYSTLAKNSGILSKEYQELAIDIDWLNSPFLREMKEAISGGLRRKEFKMTRSKSGFLPELDLPLHRKESHTTVNN
ncbi:MAG: hypothetical protein H6625_02675 [Bdellovibrionaceae bacterium]|nr:hypothetical protein [Pseudobdellovibrionaceae bacterium]